MAGDAETTTQAETAQSAAGGDEGASDEEEKKEGEEERKEGEEETKEEEFEYDSDYDEEGRYIWGEENEDWEFYYQEDKEAYEAGLSTVPECMNPSALPKTGDAVSVVSTTASGAGVNNIIGVSLARDGAVYRTNKKKLKASMRQQAVQDAANSGAWRNY